MRVHRVLVTGAAGQIGSALVPALRAAYGDDAVLATDLHPPVTPDAGPWAVLDPGGRLIAVYEAFRDAEAKPAVVLPTAGR